MIPLSNLKLDDIRALTSNFQVPIYERMHYSAGPNLEKPRALKWGSLDYQLIDKLSYEKIDSLCHYPEAIPSLDNFNFVGKNILILGSSKPWLELFLLKRGCKKILTVEYREILWNLMNCSMESWKSITYDELLNLAKLKIKDNSIDYCISYSSLEHSGLGRYGDPFNANGDLESLNVLKSYLSPQCTYLLAMPLGPDCILFNRHRVYGMKRLAMVAKVLNREKLSIIRPRKNFLRSSEIPAICYTEELNNIITKHDIHAGDGTQMLLKL